MWDLKACRSCLSTTGKLERATETCRRIYAAVTGLEYNTGDGYPTYFCVECHTQLKKCLSFRRKSRRAYYALNRFMTSKKQITLNDIITVNRRRNNLVSSLGANKRASIACFRYSEAATAPEQTDDVDTKVGADNIPTKTLTAQEFYNEFLSTDGQKIDVPADTEDTKPLVKSNDLEKYEPLHIGSVFQTIEIKCKEQLEYEKNELLKVLEDNTDNVSANNDGDLEEEIKPVIDLEDVFKDLVEDVQDSESEPEVDIRKTKKQLKEERKAKRKELLEKKDKDNWMNKVSKSLAFCDVKPQSVEEQKENWQKKMLTEPYRSARVKCLVCVKAFAKIDLLMEHVKYHNNTMYTVPCPICKANFLTAEDCETHQYGSHLYIYECKLCPNVIYTLEEFAEHYYIKHYTQKPTRILASNNLAMLYDVQQLSCEEMKKGVRIPMANSHQCESCRMYFKTLEALTLHSRKHDLSSLTSSNPVCEYCQIWFATKTGLHRHMERWHLYSYKCKMCTVVLYCREDAFKHRDKHMVKGKLDGDSNCPYCGDVNNVRSLAFHIFKHHYTEKYHHHCVACGKSSSKDTVLYKHQLEEHGRIILPSLKVGDPQFTCTHCDVQFLSQNAYYTHALKHRHPEAESIPFGCPPCRVRFDTEEEFNLHLRRCKGSKYPKNCVYCDIVLTSTANSVKHYMTVHKDLSYHRLGPASQCLRYVLCEICGASVKSSHIAAHQRAHDSGLLRCSLCDASQFTTPRQLLLHVLKSHADKPFICMICQFKFKQRAQCRDHILKTHAPVRPYSCKSCPLKFSHVDYLNDHAFKIHEVPLPGRGPKKKLRGVCTTYPHMQVDISLVPKHIIPEVQFRICDYHDRNLTPLRDINRFFLTERPAERPPIIQPPVLPEIELKVKTNKRNHDDEEDTPKKKVKIESENDKSAYDIFIEHVKPDKEEDVKVESVPDFQDFGTEVLDEEVLMGEDDVKIDGEDTYEVVEGEDGDQYVFIDGVMYRIEQQEQ